MFQAWGTSNGAELLPLFPASVLLIAAFGLNFALICRLVYKILWKCSTSFSSDHVILFFIFWFAFLGISDSFLAKPNTLSFCGSVHYYHISLCGM